jgi:SagB-type dehydrogenase family enzyme
MKKIVFILIFSIMTAAHLFAQELQTIRLNTPNKSRGSAFMKALSDRHSEREFDTKDLSLQDLSDLLWAANGVNRSDGRRTAPSAMNRQEIDVYVVRPDGAYRYDAAQHLLTPLTKGDHRQAVADGQDFAATAPLCIVLVAQLEKLGDPANEQTRLIAAMDAGIVCQNINLFCAAADLSTVPRATMDKEKLTKVLQLTDRQLIMLNNPVGYPGK